MRFWKKVFTPVSFLICISFVPINGMADNGNKEEKEKSAYTFTMDRELKRTSVKNQGRTGTCWCFATLSFLESELLRMGKDEVDLSEMFVVRHTYPLKASNYIVLHGGAEFGEGGQGHDVLDQIKKYGIVPEEVYTGMRIDENQHNHGEMATVFKSMLDGVLAKKGGRITPRWMEAFCAVADAYLGKPPESFTYKEKLFTPQTFLKDYLGLDLDCYMELTSYNHCPFYKKCRLEIPDNWTYNSDYYNVPIDDLVRIVDYAIQKGYSVAWDGDVSERDFDTRKTGYAIVPLKDWDDMTSKEREEKITEPVQEKTITQEMRQKTFANFTTTDDHLMHIVGIAHDQKGTKFYFTKNSHGTDRKNEGYVYLSESYLRLKTVAIMIHKDSLPSDIKIKLELK